MDQQLKRDLQMQETLTDLVMEAVQHLSEEDLEELEEWEPGYPISDRLNRAIGAAIKAGVDRRLGK